MTTSNAKISDLIHKLRNPHTERGGSKTVSEFDAAQAAAALEELCVQLEDINKAVYPNDKFGGAPPTELVHGITALHAAFQSSAAQVDSLERKLRSVGSRPAIKNCGSCGWYRATRFDKGSVGGCGYSGGLGPVRAADTPPDTCPLRKL